MYETLAKKDYPCFLRNATPKKGYYMAMKMTLLVGGAENDDDKLVLEIFTSGTDP